MRISIGNDHAGTKLKQAVKFYLEKNGHEVKNHGTDLNQSVDYPDFIHPVANDVKKVIGEDIEIINSQTKDNRSYHVSSKKIQEVLGFNTARTVRNAVQDLKNAFESNLLPNSLKDEKYFNIKRMQSIQLV